MTSPFVGEFWVLQTPWFDSQPSQEILAAVEITCIDISEHYGDPLTVGYRYVDRKRRIISSKARGWLDFKTEYRPATIEETILIRMRFPLTEEQMKQKQLLEEKTNALQTVR